MPQMANITIKDVDGTTDKVFVALTPAGADGSPAVWRWDGDTTRLPSQRPRFEISSRWNATKTARKVSYFYDHPIVQATAVADVKEVIGRVQNRGGDFIYPQNCPDTTVLVAANWMAKLLSSALVQDSLKSGYAPN